MPLTPNFTTKYKTTIQNNGGQGVETKLAVKSLKIDRVRTNPLSHASY